MRKGENIVLDGNSRVNETKRRRIFSNDELVPVDEFDKKENIAHEKSTKKVIAMKK